MVTAGRVARAGLAALLLAAPAARAEPAAPEPAPACRASARSLPAEGYPGQQFVWQLEILRRADVTHVEWLEPPAFPGFRAEWLPGQPERAGITRDGVEWIARVEERALFAERSGELVIAPRGLLCRLAGGAQVAAPITPTRLRVLALPQTGRPPDFSGVVGSVGLSVTAQPRTLALGGSARIELTLEADANLWDARDPLRDAAGLAGLEVFATPPRLELDPGPTLGVRRSFAWDIVPSREGRIQLPELRVPYFDPALRRYAVATAPALWLDVGPRAARPAPEPIASTDVAAPETSLRGRVLTAGAFAALAAGAGYFWLRRRRARGLDRAAMHAALAATAGAADAPALARALRLALAPELPGARSAAGEELRAPPGASVACAQALALLARVERSRFDPQAACPPRVDVVAAIEALARR